MNEPLSYASPARLTSALPSGLSPLSIEQIAAVAGARARLRPIHRAITAAKMDGYSLAVFAGLTLLCGFTSLSAMVVGAGLGIVAAIELRTMDKLRKLDPAGPKTLAINQLALAAVLIVYAFWNLAQPGDIAKQFASSGVNLQDSGFDIAAIEHSLNTLVYGVLIVVAILAQGSMAWFYFRRVKMITRYVAETPAWIVEMIRANAL